MIIMSDMVTSTDQNPDPFAYLDACRKNKVPRPGFLSSAPFRAHINIDKEFKNVGH
jgi:hypothetical protein